MLTSFHSQSEQGVSSCSLTTTITGSLLVTINILKLTPICVFMLFLNTNFYFFKLISKWCNVTKYIYSSTVLQYHFAVLLLYFSISIPLDMSDSFQFQIINTKYKSTNKLWCIIMDLDTWQYIQKYRNAAAKAEIGCWGLYVWYFKYILMLILIYFYL